MVKLNKALLHKQEHQRYFLL